jgi:hypothetical protein
MRTKEIFVIHLLLCLLLPGGPKVAGQETPISIPNARSAYGPSLALLNGEVYAAWRGGGAPDADEDDEQLYLAALREGQWAGPWPLPARSMFSPALAVHGDTLYLAWHGPGNLFTGTGDGAIYLGDYKTGRGFRCLGAIPQASSAGPPSMAVFQGRLYAAWRGAGNVTLGMVRGNEHWILYATFDFKREKWSSAEQPLFSIVHANSTSGPCLATVNDQLHAIWRGTGSLTFHGPNPDPGDPFLYHASFDGKSWSAQILPLPTIPGARSAWRASATAWQGRLCVGWRGDQPWDGALGDQTFYFSVLNEDKAWQPLNLPRQALAGAFDPSLASSGEELWVGWRGEFDSSRNLDDQGMQLTCFKASDLAP